MGYQHIFLAEQLERVVCNQHKTQLMYLMLRSGSNSCNVVRVLSWIVVKILNFSEKGPEIVVEFFCPLWLVHEMFMYQEMYET